MPNELAPICDRVIYECLKMLPLKLHWHSEPTLFESTRESLLPSRKFQNSTARSQLGKLRDDLPALLARLEILTGIQPLQKPELQ